MKEKPNATITTLTWDFLIKTIHKDFLTTVEVEENCPKYIVSYAKRLKELDDEYAQENHFREPK